MTEVMRGKTVLFTGASRGMGRLAAIKLAQLGAEILVVGHPNGGTG
jgi:NAD(P)-dependent dehydrogenase (short-subunit alcohol dehydrogenase family)